MGDIGQASECCDALFCPTQSVLMEDEPSLEMVKELLSMFLLMLACFVILCLFLF
jgi:hypothetical protein